MNFDYMSFLPASSSMPLTTQGRFVNMTVRLHFPMSNILEVKSYKNINAEGKGAEYFVHGGADGGQV